MLSEYTCIRSISNSDHIIGLHNLAESKKFDCFAITETFLSSNTTPIAVRDWSRASESDLCAIDLGSIPGGGQLRVV